MAIYEHLMLSFFFFFVPPLAPKWWSDWMGFVSLFILLIIIWVFFSLGQATRHAKCVLFKRFFVELSNGWYMHCGDTMLCQNKHWFRSFRSARESWNLVEWILSRAPLVLIMLIPYSLIDWWIRAMIWWFRLSENWGRSPFFHSCARTIYISCLSPWKTSILMQSILAHEMFHAHEKYRANNNGNSEFVSGDSFVQWQIEANANHWWFEIKHTWNEAKPLIIGHINRKTPIKLCVGVVWCELHSIESIRKWVVVFEGFCFSLCVRK